MVQALGCDGVAGSVEGPTGTGLGRLEIVNGVAWDDNLNFLTVAGREVSVA